MTLDFINREHDMESLQDLSSILFLSLCQI